ncbi:STM2901 family protein [Rahnella aquatilis]|uniref:STM2901 family protein n=1 Tax=Rahnella aquatilis TaxID=34038 RepID=UPI003648CC3B
MDTVEQLNGTYFYDGASNLSAGELFFWIMVDETLDQLGLSDLVGVAAFYYGKNNIDVPGKPCTATPGTSKASKTMRKYLRGKMLPFKLPTVIGYFPPKMKIVMVKKLSTFVGRTIPVLGVAIIAYDVSSIAYRSVNKYNTIANPKDRLF